MTKPRTREQIREEIKKEFEREMKNLWEKLKIARATSKFNGNGREVITKCKAEWALIKGCLERNNWKAPFVKERVSPRLGAAAVIAARYFLGDEPKVYFSEYGVTVICKGYQC